MRPRILTITVALLALLAGVSSAVAAARLDATIERLITGGNMGGATVGVSVREAGSGTSITSILADEPLIPASNMKLLTSGAALVTLGPDFSFRTKLLLDGDRLIVVGSGDPGFADPELLPLMTRPGDAEGPGLGIDDFLELWLAAIVEHAPKSIREIVVDDRVFDRTFVHESWPRDQLNRWYSAQVAGLSVHLNVVHFFPAPRPGKRPSLSNFQPFARNLIIENNATSRTGVHADDTVWIARRLGTNELTFYANVKHAYRTPVPVTIHDPPQFFADLLSERLEARGVDVGDARTARIGEGEPTGEVIGPVITTPIGTAITRCNRDSESLYAECLLKRMGHEMTGQPGSWQTGGAIIRHVLHDRLGSGALSARLVTADGSGLSRNNRVAPATLTAWLNVFHNDDDLREVFLDSFAVGGRTGTLRSRFRGAKRSGAVIQAKTGYVNGVSCLSGYITMPDGRRRCFSIMINDIDVPIGRAKDLQDRIVLAIVE
ncbi:MAG: D-alanyl-D-alanine carboxypeptidase/D-alanyl-D-alanine-endopeptidase, partial [Planctomycetes bacterium]|nr:D-alanyl-D-alanine carboxypeptidase/D-alanyl-D-alanine-endopeptidase [Planctomycetota bacterium]